MSKRRLSDQQTKRIQAQQQAILEAPFLQDDLNCHEAIIIANRGQFLEVMTKGQVYRCLSRQNLGGLVPGDRVIVGLPLLNEEYGIIKAVHPRRTELARPDRHKQKKCIAANIDLMLIVVAHEPECIPYRIDQYLVAAEHAGFQSIIVWNKIDGLNPEQHLIIEKQLREYPGLGINVLKVSAKQKIGIEALLHTMQMKQAIVVGQSGVGKSSLVNALLDQPLAEVGEMSVANQKGRHTTTTARLYCLSQQAMLVDSPGIREFGLWHLTPEEMIAGFQEFKSYLQQCRFRNCQHRAGAEGCALIQAVNQGKISTERLQSYYRMVDSAD